jgi:hypothetical protein
LAGKKPEQMQNKQSGVKILIKKRQLTEYNYFFTNVTFIKKIPCKNNPPKKCFMIYIFRYLSMPIIKGGYTTNRNSCPSG